ncbi:class I SAM-dependent methyltransferase [Providencia vermicola]|uniref:class I SAM-dependent methyltransferase n=1 Tax=Providencia vermicola TaxID=333965 RepID=UPI0032DA213B
MQEQNIYDNPIFFDQYKSLRMNDTGLNGIMEEPALRALLPSLKGKVILDLGSGFGDFARYAHSAGAKKVYGVELSKNMIEQATQLTHTDDIEYIQTSMTDLTMLNGNFDLVISSLAIHYIENFNQLAITIYSQLKEGGKFIFSVEHPMCTAQSSSFTKNDTGEFQCMAVDNYQDESIRHTTWFVDNVIKYHRTIESYVSGLLNAGFTLEALKEPKVIPSALQEKPETAIFNRYSPFLLLGARR